MNILLLGGTGNISREVAALLVQQRHQVTLLNRGSHPLPEAYRQLRGDRYDLASMQSALANSTWDAVVDFIGYLPPQMETAWQALRGRTAQFVFISSTTVYQKPPSGKLPITEQEPLGNTFWQYARDKQACEDFLWSVNAPDFPVTIVRPSHTLGQGWIPSPFCRSDFTVATRILQSKPVIVPDEGQSLWTLTAASDLAAGLAGLLGNPAAHGEAFHITSDTPLTWNAIYDEIGRALGRQPEIVHIPTDFLCERQPELIGNLKGDKAEHALFDNSKIKRFAPDFECRKSPRQIIRENVGWVLADSARQKVNPEMDQRVERLISEWESLR